jgi:hypothetical protein
MAAMQLSMIWNKTMLFVVFCRQAPLGVGEAKFFDPTGAPEV